jgi:hypothetical protein
MCNSSIFVNNYSECNPANGPSVISKPFVLPKLPSGKSDKFTTFSRPSAPQNDFEQRQSLEIQRTIVFSKALSLNLRTDAAHVPVSTLGKIFKTSFCLKNHSASNGRSF